MGKLKYKVGDIIGVCADEMYEFEITQLSEEEKVYGAKCVMAHADASIKCGEEYKILPKQIVVLLGKNGKKFD